MPAWKLSYTISHAISYLGIVCDIVYIKSEKSDYACDIACDIAWDIDSVPVVDRCDKTKKCAI